MWFKQFVQVITVCAGLYLPLFCSVPVVIEKKIKNLTGRQFKKAISRGQSAFISMKVIYHKGFIPKKGITFAFNVLLVKSVIKFDYGYAGLEGMC